MAVLEYWPSLMQYLRVLVRGPRYIKNLTDRGVVAYIDDILINARIEVK